MHTGRGISTDVKPQNDLLPLDRAEVYLVLHLPLDLEDHVCLHFNKYIDLDKRSQKANLQLQLSQKGRTMSASYTFLPTLPIGCCLLYRPFPETNRNKLL